MSNTPLDFFCSSCGQELTSPPELFGKSLTCPACGAVLTVPNGPNLAQTGAPSSAPQGHGGLGTSGAYQSTPPPPRTVSAVSRPNVPRSVETANAKSKSEKKSRHVPSYVSYVVLGILVIFLIIPAVRLVLGKADVAQTPISKNDLPTPPVAQISPNLASNPKSLDSGGVLGSAVGEQASGQPGLTATGSGESGKSEGTNKNTAATPATVEGPPDDIVRAGIERLGHDATKPFRRGQTVASGGAGGIVKNTLMYPIKSSDLRFPIYLFQDAFGDWGVFVEGMTGPIEIKTSETIATPKNSIEPVATRENKKEPESVSRDRDNSQNTGVYPAGGPEKDVEIGWFHPTKSRNINFVNFSVVNNIVYYCDTEYMHVTALNENGGVLWDYDTKEFVSGPAVFDGIVYCLCYYEGKQTNVIAIDSLTGKLKWKFNISKDPIVTIPVVYGNCLYISDQDKGLFGINRFTGEQLWKLNVKYRVFGEVAVSGGLVYCCSVNEGGPNSSGSICALSIDGRNQAWEYLPKQSSEAQLDITEIFKPRPIVLQETLYLSSCEIFGDKNQATKRGSITALDLKTGYLKWKQSYPEISSAGVAIENGRIFLGTTDGLVATREKTADVVWKYKTEHPVLSRPAISGNSIYFGESNGHVCALNKETGQLKWRYKLAQSQDVRASPIISNGAAYISGKDGIYKIITKSLSDTTDQGGVSGKFNGATPKPVDEKIDRTTAPSPSNVTRSTPQESKSLSELKGDLAVIETKIKSERQRWQQAENTIHRLTDNHHSYLKPGTPPYVQCEQATLVKDEIQKGAPDLNAEKARLEAMIKDLESK